MSQLGQALLVSTCRMMQDLQTATHRGHNWSERFGFGREEYEKVESTLTRVETFHDSDGINEVSFAKLALDVRVQLGHIEPPLLRPLPSHLLLCHDRLGRLLHGRRHLHPVLVLQRGWTRRGGTLLHRLHRSCLKKGKITFELLLCESMTLHHISFHYLPFPVIPS